MEISVVHLRKMLSDVLYRVHVVQNNAHALLHMEGSFPLESLMLDTEVFLARCDEPDVDEWSLEQEEEELREVVRSRQILSSRVALDRLLDESGTVSAPLKRMMERREFSTREVLDTEFVPSEVEPSTAGWTRFELKVIEDKYKSEICRHVCWLRDVATRMRYIERKKHLIPSRFKSLCGFGELPLEGGAPHYEADDFSDTANRSLASGVPFLSKKWQWLLFGNNSDKVLERFRIISEVSQPRENEPPACEWNGSHHSNEVRFEDLNPDQS